MTMKQFTQSYILQGLLHLFPAQVSFILKLKNLIKLDIHANTQKSKS